MRKTYFCIGLVCLGMVLGMGVWADEWDPRDDTPYGATNLGVIPYDGIEHPDHTLNPSDTEDFFRFTLRGGYSYGIYSMGYYNADLTGYMIDEEGQEYWDEESGFNSNFAFIISPKENTSKEFTLRVMRQTDAGDYKYDLYIEAFDDPWDPNEDTDTATNLGRPTDKEQTLGPLVLGGINYDDGGASDSSDIIQFFLEKDKTYTFWTTGQNDTRATLRQGSTLGTILGNDEDSGPDKNFKIEYTPTSDVRVYLKIGMNADEGAYTLHYLHEPEVEQLDPWEPDHPYDNATPLDVPTDQWQTNGPHLLKKNIDDEDYFRFELPSGQNYIFRAKGNAKADGQILDKYGRVVKLEPFSGNPEYPFVIDYRVLYQGVYYIAAILFAPEDNVEYSYELSYIGSHEPEAVELDTPTEEEQVLSSQKLEPSDIHWYKFVLFEGVRYEFWSTGGSDVYAELYKHDTSRQVQVDDDSSDGMNFKIDYKPWESDAFYLAVRSNDHGEMAEYDLHYKIVTVSTDTVIGGEIVNSAVLETVDIPIYVENLAETKSMTFDVVFDSDKLAWGSDARVIRLDTMLAAWVNIQANEVEPGRLRVAATAFAGSGVERDGVLVILRFDVGSGVEENSHTTISFENLKDGLQGAQTDDVLIIFTIKPEKGDVNMDGEITASDAQLAFQISLDSAGDVTEDQIWAADMTEDGVVTAEDAQQILLAAAGINLSGKTVRPQALGDETEGDDYTIITVERVQAAPGDSVSVPVRIDPDRDIRAIFVEFSYDRNKMSFVGEDFEGTMLERFYFAGTSEYYPGKVRLAAAASLNRPIQEEGVLCKLNFKVNDDASGVSTISIKTVLDDLLGAETVTGYVAILEEEMTTIGNWMVY